MVIFVKRESWGVGGASSHNGRHPWRSLPDTPACPIFVTPAYPRFVTPATAPGSSYPHRR